MSNKTIIREALEYGKQLRPRSPLFAAALAELDREEGPVAHAHLPPGVDPIDDVAHHVLLSFDHLKPYEDDEAAESSAYAERLEEVGAILAHAWSYAVKSGYAYAAPPATVSYAMSRDYEALYDLLCKGGEAFCLVDMDWNDGTPPSRDAARIRRREEWYIDVGARGICYGGVRPYHKRNGEFKDEFKEMEAKCQRLNLEWLAPVDLSEILEAGNEIIRTYKGFHAAIAQDTGKPYPWDPIETAMDRWTAVTAKHRKP
jgi:hypothetical protein